jgi:hypothetical protein
MEPWSASIQLDDSFGNVKGPSKTKNPGSFSATGV